MSGNVLTIRSVRQPSSTSSEFTHTHTHTHARMHQLLLILQCNTVTYAHADVLMTHSQRTRCSFTPKRRALRFHVSWETSFTLGLIFANRQLSFLHPQCHVDSWCLMWDTKICPWRKAQFASLRIKLFFFHRGDLNGFADAGNKESCLGNSKRAVSRAAGCEPAKLLCSWVHLLL